jgi:hypothetical protein
MDIKKLQEEVNARWGSQENNPCHGSDPNHALVHMVKALGKVASALNDAEHEERAPRAEEIDKYLADLVICAARFGYGIVDLDAVCVARLEEKFPESGGGFRYDALFAWRDELTDRWGEELVDLLSTLGDEKIDHRLPAALRSLWDSFGKLDEEMRFKLAEAWVERTEQRFRDNQSRKKMEKVERSF